MEGQVQSVKPMTRVMRMRAKLPRRMTKGPHLYNVPFAITFECYISTIPQRAQGQYLSSNSVSRSSVEAGETSAGPTTCEIMRDKGISDSCVLCRP